MLSDEEKKAIDWFREDLAEEKENCGKYNDYKKQVIRRNERLLNLIEKQSKEIEELKYKYSDEKIRNTIIKRYKEVIEKDYVSKDKIKSKIDYLLKHYDSENFINFEMFIKILQSLLEKELPTTITKEELEKRWKGVDIWTMKILK